MKPNKLVATRIIISIHVRRGQYVKLKYARYQLANDILLKRSYDSHLFPKCIQAYVTRYQYFHTTTILRKKDARPLHSMTIEHPSKQGKLNGVDKIFPYLFKPHKYTLMTIIYFDDVEASQSLQFNVFIKFGVPYCLIMKLISKHSTDCLLQTIQRTIIKHYKDWHDRVTCQTALGIFSFSLVYRKKLSLSPNISLSSLLLAQSSQGQSFDVIQSQIKYFLKVENKSSYPKEEYHVFVFGNLCFQINNLVMNWDKVRKD